MTPAKKRRDAPLIKIQITNRTYGKVANQPLFVTEELRKKLEKQKRRDGSTAYTALQARGFRGGKHILELVANRLGAATKIVLSHESSRLSGATLTIDFERYQELGSRRFFELYRGTGMEVASAFLSDAFPAQFPPSAAPAIPPKKEVKRVLANLPAAAETLANRDRAKLPEQIAALVEKQGPEFVLDLLKVLDETLQGSSGRLRAAFTDVITRLAKEPAKAMVELADLMEKWNLVQVTSLLSVLKTRLDVIETFEQLIHDANTYELKEENSIHRTLERSMWLLDDSYWIAQSNKSLRTFFGKELPKADKQFEKRRPDFACVDALGKTVLVEIKRPSVELKKEECDQAELYLRLVKKYKTQPKKPEIFLIGNTISEEARDVAEMRGYPALMTFQDMIESSRSRYQEYLRIVEGAS